MTTPSLIDYDAVTNTSLTLGGITITLTLSSGTNRVALCVATNDRDTASAPVSATFNGNAMTAGTARTSASNLYRYLSFTYAIPDGLGNGDYDIVITYQNLDKKPGAHAAIFKDVNSIGAEVDGTGMNSSVSPVNPTWTVSSASGDLVVGMVFVFSASDASVDATSPATVAGFEDISFAGAPAYFGCWQEAGGTSVVLDGTIPSGGTGWWGTAWSLAQSTGGASADGGGMLLSTRRNRLTIP